MINKELNPPLFVNSVKTSGDTSNLAVGEFMIVDVLQSTPNGLKYADNLSKPRNKKSYRIDVGATKIVDARSMVHRNKTTPRFALEDLDRIDVAYPVNPTQEVDSWVVGYNGGIDISTALNFQSEDKVFFVVMELDGGAIPYSAGGAQKERFVFEQNIEELLPYNSCNNSDPCAILPCKGIVKELIERMREREYSGGHKLKEVVDITPVFSCGEPDGTYKYTEYTLQTCDLGDEPSKAVIQAGTPYRVELINRIGSTSTYKILVPGDAVPTNITVQGLAFLAECDTCPDDITQIDGGFIYTYTINTTSTTPAIITIPGQIAGTNVLQGVYNGLATYTVRLSSVLTSAQISTLSTANPTLVIDMVGEALTVCQFKDYTLEWTAGDSFNGSAKTFKIDLPDTRCGDDRLNELVLSYPEYEVSLDPSSTANTYSLTLAGTTGTGVLTIGETDFTVTFATNLSQTATNFVTENSAEVVAMGGKLSADGVRIIIELPSLLGAPTYVASGVTGTIAVVSSGSLSKGCRNTYQIIVPTNFRGEECDEVFKDFFSAETPRPFMEHEWKIVDEETENEGCLCGIKITAKTFNLNPEACLENKVKFIESSTGLKVTAGFAKTMSGYMDLSLAGNDYKEVHCKQLTFKKDRDMLGGNLKELEMQSNIHFLGRGTETSPIRKALLGTETILENEKQHVKYSLVMNTAKQTQGFSHRSISQFISYDIYAPLGANVELEKELMRLSSKAGIPYGNPSM